jgi:hypothetical protein
MKQLTFIQNDTPEWNHMWSIIYKMFDDYSCMCKETGEAWQYMGTYEGFHEFRHRHLPSDKFPLYPMPYGVRYTRTGGNRVYMKIKRAYEVI